MEAVLGTTLPVWIGLTLILMGGAAMLAGRAIGDHWKPAWQAVAAGFGLALFDQFLGYALFEGQLINLAAFLIDLVVLAAIALAARRITLVARTVQQYPWRYARSTLFNYVEKPGT